MSTVRDRVGVASTREGEDGIGVSTVTPVTGSKAPTQLALGWNTGRARRGDPSTSVLAGAAVDVPRRCAEVLAVLRRLGRCTAYDITVDLVLNGVGTQMNAVGRRLLDLERRGLAQRDGIAPGGFGRDVTAWRAA